MVATLDLLDFLELFGISSKDDIYNIEYILGPTIVEDKLSNLTYSINSHPSLTPIIKIGSFDICDDFLGSIVVTRSETEDDESSLEATLF